MLCDCKHLLMKREKKYRKTTLTTVATDTNTIIISRRPPLLKGLK